MLVLKTKKGIFRYFFENFGVPNSVLICTVLSLEYSIRAFQIFVFAVLRISSNNYFHWALRTFHEELIDFCCVEVVNPLLNCIEPNTLGYHILAAFASDVKGCFVSDCLSANRLSLDANERLALLEITLARLYFRRVVVFGEVEIISTGCGKSTHYLIIIRESIFNLNYVNT